MSTKSKIILIFGVVVLSTVIFVTGLLLDNEENLGSVIKVSTIASTDLFIARIEALQTQVQRPDIPHEAQTQLGRALNSTTKYATQWAIATPTEIIGYKIPDGIDDTPEAAFSRIMFTPLNSWRKTTPEQYHLVYAGYITQDAEQGAVFVFHPEQFYRFTLFITPKRSGAVKVVAESGTTITLESSDGNLFYFDATTENFINSQGIPLITTPFVPTSTSVNFSYSTSSLSSP